MRYTGLNAHRPNLLCGMLKAFLLGSIKCFSSMNQNQSQISFCRCTIVIQDCYHKNRNWSLTFCSSLSGGVTKSYLSLQLFKTSNVVFTVTLLNTGGNLWLYINDDKLNISVPPFRWQQVKNCTYMLEKKENNKQKQLQQTPQQIFLFQNGLFYSR